MDSDYNNNYTFDLKMSSLTQTEELELFRCAALSSFVTVVQACWHDGPAPAPQQWHLLLILMFDYVYQGLHDF